MKKIGRTINKGEMVDVFECEEHKIRSLVSNCEACIRENHEEEASIGLI